MVATGVAIARDSSQPRATDRATTIRPPIISVTLAARIADIWALAQVCSTPV